MADRDALAARVAGILIDDNADAVARIVPEIQKAQKDVEERSYKFICQETWIDPNPTVSVGNAVVASVPSDFIEPHGEAFRLEQDANDGMVTPPLDWLELGDESIKAYSGSFENPIVTDRGPPKALWINVVDDDITTFPVPDDTYTLWVPYYKRLTTLSAGATTNWWTENLEDYLVFRAAARVLNFNEDPKYLKYEVMAEAEYKRGRKANKRTRYRFQSNRIRPRRDVGSTFQQRRM
jgi:hypothetical protein